MTRMDIHPNLSLRSPLRLISWVLGLVFLLFGTPVHADSGIGFVYLPPLECEGTCPPKAEREVSEAVEAMLTQKLAHTGWVLLTNDNMLTVVAEQGVDAVKILERSQGTLDQARAFHARFLVSAQMTSSTGNLRLRLIDVRKGTPTVNRSGSTATAESTTKLVDGFGAALAGAIPGVSEPVANKTEVKVRRAVSLTVSSDDAGHAKALERALRTASRSGGVTFGKGAGYPSVSVELSSRVVPVPGSSLRNCIVHVEVTWTSAAGEDPDEFSLEERATDIDPDGGIRRALDGAANKAMKKISVIQESDR